jgi:hypothetical protein
LLTRIRRSIFRAFDDGEARKTWLNERRSWRALPSEENCSQKYTHGGSYQNPRANLLAAEADFNVKKMAQRGSGHHRCDQNAEQISHPKLGWIHSSD